ncbi:MAG TPA: hypothetical protein GX747_04260, partial [Tenericutes bacterium]|nr:hypothetical protein [Mycoplasmatota bacterium]
ENRYIVKDFPIKREYSTKTYININLINKKNKIIQLPKIQTILTDNIFSIKEEGNKYVIYPNRYEDTIDEFDLRNNDLYKKYLGFRYGDDLVNFLRPFKKIHFDFFENRIYINKINTKMLLLAKTKKFLITRKNHFINILKEKSKVIQLNKTKKR